MSKITDLTEASSITGDEYTELSKAGNPRKGKLSNYVGTDWFDELSGDFASFVAPSADSATTATTIDGESESSLHDATQLTGGLYLSSVPDELTGKTVDSAQSADNAVSLSEPLDTLEYLGVENSILGLNVSGYNAGCVCALTKDIIVLSDVGEDNITAYKITGKSIVKLGSSYSVTNGGGSITALNSTDIVKTDPYSGTVQAYRFNGSTWATLGSAASITQYYITALSSTRIASVGSGKLSTYDFSGSAWSKVGNSLSISGTPTDMATLNNTDIALMNVTSGTLTTYRFDGTDWAKVGNSLSVSGITGNYYDLITALNQTTIVLSNPTDGYLYIYVFDGTDWAQTGWAGYTQHYNTDNNPICALSDRYIAFYNRYSSTGFSHLRIYPIAKQNKPQEV